MPVMRMLPLALWAATCATGSDVHLPPPAARQASHSTYRHAERALSEHMARPQRREGRAKNVILFVGDGNGISTNYATRLWAGQQAGGYGDEFELTHERMEHLALSKTYNTNAQTPDSAATATALNTGIKTKSGVLNLGEAARRLRCEDVPGNEASTFAELAKDMGKRVGIVTTTRVSHATPAAVYCHSADRNWESSVPEGCEQFQEDISLQLVHQMERGAVDVALGGGRRTFLPDGQSGPEPGEQGPGERRDNRNLISEHTQRGGRYVWDAASLSALDRTQDTPVLGLFDLSHMQFEHDRNASQPALVTMTAAAIEMLERGDAGEGYYLMVEGGRIDHANHAGNLLRAVTDGVAYQAAIAYALDHVDLENTLVVSTADHSHGLEFNGYCGRGSPVTGLCYKIDDEGERHLDEATLGTDGKPYTVAGFLNGQGSVLQSGGPNEIRDGRRPNISAAQATAPNYVQQALIPMGLGESETHSATDVGIYASGPWSQLLDGTVEQNYIYHVMRHAVLAPDKHNEGLAAAAQKQRSMEAPMQATGTEQSAHGAHSGATFGLAGLLLGMGGSALFGHLRERRRRGECQGQGQGDPEQQGSYEEILPPAAAPLEAAPMLSPWE